MSAKTSLPLNSSSEQSKNFPPSKIKKNIQQPSQSYKKSNRLKIDIHPQNNKILRYLRNNSSLPVNSLDTKVIPQKSNDTIQKMEQKIKQKQKIIRDLRDKKQQEEQKYNNAIFQYKIFSQKSKLILSKVQLQLAEIQRKQKFSKNNRIGTFNQINQTFEESQYVKQLRNKLKEKKKVIEQLNELKKSKKYNNFQEAMRIQSSSQFLHKEIMEMQKELDYLERQIIVQKQKAKLLIKERKSLYFQRGWPIVYENYQTLELLGAGGFGQVYKCFDLQTRQYTAIKLVQPTHKKQQQRVEAFQYMLRQVQTLKILDHPNIAKFKKVLQVLPSQCLLVFQIQYLQGPQLSTFLKRFGHIQEKLAKNIIKQLFSALDYMSSLKNKIIHYDIKPGNIMFHNGIVKLLDFGLSKIISTQDTKTRLTSMGIGTYWYLPPQCFDMNSQKISNKVDVWSLGVVFYELLYGKKPFGHGISQNTIYQQGIILNARNVQFPHDTRNRVSQGAKQFIKQCLCYEEAERLTPKQANDHVYFKK